MDDHNEGQGTTTADGPCAETGAVGCTLSSPDTFSAAMATTGRRTLGDADGNVAARPRRRSICMASNGRSGTHGTTDGTTFLATDGTAILNTTICSTASTTSLVTAGSHASGERPDGGDRCSE